MDGTPVPGQADTILIVDDDDALVPLIRRMVERMGFKTVVAPNAEEGIQAYRDRRDCIAVVITDLMMSGTDGRAFARQLLTENPDVRILISTGLNDPSDMAALEQMGVKGFVFKPYTAKDLSEKIQKALA